MCQLDRVMVCRFQTNSREVEAPGSETTTTKLLSFRRTLVRLKPLYRCGRVDRRTRFQTNSREVEAESTLDVVVCVETVSDELS